MNKVKLIIARRLNRNPKACWANLVMWAMGYQSLGETFRVDGNWKSQICSDPYYCGKCSPLNKQEEKG